MNRSAAAGRCAFIRCAATGVLPASSPRAGWGGGTRRAGRRGGGWGGGGVGGGEAAAAAEVLGLADLAFLRRPDWFVGEGVDEAAALLRPVLAREAPQFIYLPHDREWHPDHGAALAVVRAALRDSGIPVPDLLTYEVWTPLSEYDQVTDITPVMARKLRAVRCYRSQLAGFRYDRAVRGLNQYRGALAARCRYAEVFRYAALAEPRRERADEQVPGQEVELPAGRAGPLEIVCEEIR